MKTGILTTRREFLATSLAAAGILGLPDWLVAADEPDLELTITGPKEGDTLTEVVGRAKGFPKEGIRLRAVVMPKGDILNATGLSSISHNSAPQLILWN